jgi:hypothetical protein
MTDYTRHTEGGRRGATAGLVQRMLDREPSLSEAELARHRADESGRKWEVRWGMNISSVWSPLTNKEFVCIEIVIVEDYIFSYPQSTFELLNGGGELAHNGRERFCRWQALEDKQLTKGTRCCRSPC